MEISGLLKVGLSMDGATRPETCTVADNDDDDI